MKIDFVKFGYSEKATKFEKTFHLKFDATQYCQILSGRFFSNFVGFSEYPNFKNTNYYIKCFFRNDFKPLCKGKKVFYVSRKHIARQACLSRSSLKREINDIQWTIYHMTKVSAMMG